MPKNAFEEKNGESEENGQPEPDLYGRAKGLVFHEGCAQCESVRDHLLGYLPQLGSLSLRFRLWHEFMPDPVHSPIFTEENLRRRGMTLASLYRTMEQREGHLEIEHRETKGGHTLRGFLRP
jgi:hypothetical protein